MATSILMILPSVSSKPNTKTASVVPPTEFWHQKILQHIQQNFGIRKFCSTSNRILASEYSAVPPTEFWHQKILQYLQQNFGIRKFCSTSNRILASEHSAVPLTEFWHQKIQSAGSPLPKAWQLLTGLDGVTHKKDAIRKKMRGHAEI